MRLLYKTSIRFWLILAVVSLLVVGLLGLFMRLKVVYPIPWLNQQYLLHAHSHFAFAGWVTHALMVCVFALPKRQSRLVRPSELVLYPKEQWLILFNFIAAFGMLFAFLFQGYGIFSITVSTFSIFVSYAFSAYFWQRLKCYELGSHIKIWLRAALVFLVLSSIGTFVLAYLMVSHNTDPRRQLAAVYFYLHFQYNGWFLFACMAMLHQYLERFGVFLKAAKPFMYVFISACIPTYFLSILWWDMPNWLYWLVVVAACTQGIAWIRWVWELWQKKSAFTIRISNVIVVVLFVVGVAFTIKLTLQILSLIPQLSNLAYGFRPIVIAYLHLVLLLVISLFLVAYFFLNDQLKLNNFARLGLCLFVIGIVLNEIILGTQGLTGMLRVFVPFIPQSLVIASGVICVGVIGILFGQKNKTPK